MMSGMRPGWFDVHFIAAIVHLILHESYSKKQHDGGRVNTVPSLPTIGPSAAQSDYSCSSA